MQQIGPVTPQIQQLVWLNRNEIQRVFANKKRANNGALIIQQTIVTHGFPIEVGTLSGWMTRADYEALRTHNATNLDPFTLTLGSDTFTVIWDNTGNAAITGKDLWESSGPSDDLTDVILKFITV